MRVWLVGAAALALAGCQGIDLKGCERHYNGNVSGGTIQPAIVAGTALIDCCPVDYVATSDHKNCVPGVKVAPAR